MSFRTNSPASSVVIHQSAVAVNAHKAFSLTFPSALPRRSRWVRAVSGWSSGPSSSLSITNGDSTRDTSSGVGYIGSAADVGGGEGAVGSSVQAARARRRSSGRIRDK